MRRETRFSVSICRVRGAIIPDSTETMAGAFSRGPTVIRSRRLAWRYATENLAFGFAGWILRALPLESASWISGRIWRLLGPRVGSLRHRRTLANLAKAFQKLG